MAELAGAGRHVALWLDDAPAPEYPVLEGDQRFDAVVVGGGITGMTATLQLGCDGLSVCVLDQNWASGTTGRTTAKVTSQHHLTYARIRKTHGREGAATYA